MLSASRVVLEALHALAYRVWPIPAKAQKRFATALKTSPCSRAVTLRQQLSLIGYTDLDIVFAKVVTPAFMMALLDDLASTGALTRHEASTIQNAVLIGVRRDGTWVPKAGSR